MLEYLKRRLGLGPKTLQQPVAKPEENKTPKPPDFDAAEFQAALDLYGKRLRIACAIGNEADTTAILDQAAHSSLKTFLILVKREDYKAFHDVCYSSYGSPQYETKAAKAGVASVFLEKILQHGGAKEVVDLMELGHTLWPVSPGYWVFSLLKKSEPYERERILTCLKNAYLKFFSEDTDHHRHVSLKYDHIHGLWQLVAAFGNKELMENLFKHEESTVIGQVRWDILKQKSLTRDAIKKHTLLQTALEYGNAETTDHLLKEALKAAPSNSAKEDIFEEICEHGYWLAEPALIDTVLHHAQKTGIKSLVRNMLSWYAPDEIPSDGQNRKLRLSSLFVENCGAFSYCLRTWGNKGIPSAQELLRQARIAGGIQFEAAMLTHNNCQALRLSYKDYGPYVKVDEVLPFLWTHVNSLEEEGISGLKKKIENQLARFQTRQQAASNPFTFD